jgi:hypothetical protein
MVFVPLFFKLCDLTSAFLKQKLHLIQFLTHFYKNTHSIYYRRNKPIPLSSYTLQHTTTILLSFFAKETTTILLVSRREESGLLTCESAEPANEWTKCGFVGSSFLSLVSSIRPGSCCHQYQVSVGQTEFAGVPPMTTARKTESRTDNEQMRTGVCAAKPQQLFRVFIIAV